MKPKKMLFRLTAATDLRKGPRMPYRWIFHGETIEGNQISMTTSKIGRGELRWFPKKIMGQTIRVSYHETAKGNFIADLWRPAWAEGEDLVKLFAHERTLYLVEQEHLAIEAEVMEHQASVRRSARL